MRIRRIRHRKRYWVSSQFDLEDKQNDDDDLEGPGQTATMSVNQPAHHHSKCVNALHDGQREIWLDK